MHRRRKELNDEIHALKMIAGGQDEMMIRHQVYHNDKCFYGYIPFINLAFMPNNYGSP